MKTRKAKRWLLPVALAIGALAIAAAVIAALANGDERRRAAAEESGILEDFARKGEGELYLVNSGAAVREDAGLEAKKPYYVIAFKQSNKFSVNEDKEVFDHALDYAFTVDGKMTGGDAFAAGTVAFVATKVCDRETYSDANGNALTGTREQADIYVYDIATKTFFARTTLYGAELPEAYDRAMGSKDFVHAVGKEEIEAYLDGLS